MLVDIIVTLSSILMKTIFTPIAGFVLSPPQKLLLVNTSERKIQGRERWREETAAPPSLSSPHFNFPSSQPPRAARFFPSVQLRRNCRRPVRRRERFVLVLKLRQKELVVKWNTSGVR